jgi:D-glycero-D-manno-heptose 1,7-bisphosphate phosphatase
MGLVLLDRDGVINQDSPHYIRALDEWVPIPGSLAAIGRLNAHGWQVAICTNQSGIDRGLITWSTLEAIHERLGEGARAHGGEIEAFFVCPHTDEAGCSCRKPNPGLLKQACVTFGVSPGDVVFIGDSSRDIEAARRAGARPILVLTGNGNRTLINDEVPGYEVFADLASAVDALGPAPSQGDAS